MKWLRHLAAALALLLLASLVGVGSSPSLGASSPDEADGAEVRAELLDLADAWADGGGRFGYPFWEKAAQRWRARQLTAIFYREYVTGYRDRLALGCPLLDEIELGTREAKDVRELLATACDRRLDGLRLQQRWLDQMIRRDREREATPDEDSGRDERIAELEASSNEALQDAWRGTREAMEAAQAAMAAHAAEPIPEDAFR